MRRAFLFAAGFAVATQASPAFAVPPPPCAATTTTPAPAPVVTPETSRESASRTAGLIADRIATVVSNINVGGEHASGERLNAACPSLTDADGDAVEQLLAAASGATVKSGGPRKLNAVWTGGSFTRVKKGDVGGEYNGTVKNGIVGYDSRVTDTLILGLATGYEAVDIHTRYNNGSVEGSSVSLSPYLGYLINDWLSLDASVGHTWINYDFTSNYNSVKGSTDADRWFGSLNLNAVHHLGDAQLRGGLGYLRLYEDQDAYRDSSGADIAQTQVNFGQARATVGGAYDFVTDFGVVSPNAFVRLEYDLPAAKQVSLGNGLISSSDRTGATFGVGVDLGFGDDLLLSLSGTSTQFRQNTESYSLMANLRFSF